MSDLIVFIEKYEAETMYYHQSMKILDQKKFRESMVK